MFNQTNIDTVWRVTLGRMRDGVEHAEQLIGSVLGSLSCLMQPHGFDPPLRIIFPVDRIFSLGVNMGSDSISPNFIWMRV